MSQEPMEQAVAGSLKKDIPEFHVGDTVKVFVRIIEGQKERTQVFIGTLIARKGSGIHETFTVRRIVSNEGVERVFPIHSPKVADVEIVRRGKVRRAKLYYLRDRVGKSTRLKEVRATKSAKGQKAPLEEAPESDEAPPEVDEAPAPESEEQEA